MEDMIRDTYGEDALYTIDDVAALPEGQRAELINGRMFMMGTPTTGHQILAGGLFYAIAGYIHGNQGECVPFFAPCAVYLDAKKTKREWVEPDVFVVCDKDKIKEDGIYGAPDWVIEIASPSTIEKDFMKKASLYKTYGVREYWIVNPMGQNVTVYHFFPEFQLIQYRFDELLSPALYPGLGIRISDLVGQ